MRIRGLGAAKRAGLWARSVIRPGPIVLGYHRVARSDWDPQYLCVSPDNFATQIEMLLERATALSLDALVDGMRNGTRPDKAFVVTLDDGYADSLEIAAPILSKYGVPATVFVTTGMIGKAYWWCEIEHLVKSIDELPEHISLDVEGREYRWIRKGDGPKARARLVQSLGDLFRALPFSLHDEALEKVRGAFPGLETAESGVLAMPADDVGALSRFACMDIGSHMVTHTSLNQLSDEAQLAELRDSKSALEEITGKSIETFAYPNGRLNKASPRLAREAGYSAGCTSRQELASRQCDPMLLPRIWPGDWGREKFSQWLWRWRL